MKISKHYLTLVYIIFLTLLYIGMENYPIDSFDVFESAGEIDKALAENPQSNENRYEILIDLSESTLYLFEDGNQPFISLRMVGF